ncbi:MAG: hypothetical protein ABF290_14130 [Thiogranum sp.]|jgi:hypothetical protein
MVSCSDRDKRRRVLDALPALETVLPWTDDPVELGLKTYRRRT